MNAVDTLDISSEVRRDLLVGERIRALRKLRRKSLAELSDATGRSISYLSQIERGLSSPTLRELTTVADALGVGFLDLLAEPVGAAPASPVRKREDAALIPFRGDGVTKQVLAPRNEGTIAFYVMHIAAGGSSGVRPYTHDGEEAGYVLRGTISLTVDGRTFTVRRGDSFRFMSDLPHRFQNEGEQEAQVLWINVGGQSAAG